MLQRAEKCKRSSFRERGARGFLGSEDFPTALVKGVQKADPAGRLLPAYLQAPTNKDDVPTVLPQDQARLAVQLDKTLAGKVIFALSGGADKLVPYAEGRVFYDYLKRAIGCEDGKDGWWKNNNCVFVDRVYEGVGHQTTPEMAEDAVRFLADVALDDRVVHHGPSRL
jgi:hypothetical protein